MAIAAAIASSAIVNDRRAIDVATTASIACALATATCGSNSLAMRVTVLTSEIGFVPVVRSTRFICVGEFSSGAPGIGNIGK